MPETLTIEIKEQPGPVRPPQPIPYALPPVSYYAPPPGVSGRPPASQPKADGKTSPVASSPFQPYVLPPASRPSSPFQPYVLPPASRPELPPVQPSPILPPPATFQNPPAPAPSQPKPENGNGLGAAAEVAIAAAADPLLAGLVVVKMGLDQFADGIKATGDLMAKVGRLDVSAFGDAVEGAARRVPIFGNMVGESISAMRRFAAALDDTARKYAGYNGELAAAQAQADVRQILGDIRRANQLGPNLARYTEARSRLDQNLQDAEAQLLEKLLPLVTTGVETLNAILNFLTGSVSPQAITDAVNETIEELPNKWLALITNPAMAFAETIFGFLRKVATNTEKEQHMYQEQDFLKELLNVQLAGGAQPVQQGNFRPNFPLGF